MKPRPVHRALLLGGMISALFALSASGLLFAAEAPAGGDNVDMSTAVATRLNAVIALMDEQKLDEASVAMQAVRADMQAGMSDYEELRMLQLSGSLNMALQKAPEAIADYEAILQLPALSDDDRLLAASLAGQLYLQAADWANGVEHMLVVNELEGGQSQETLFRLAFSYAQLGDVAAAVPRMEQALALAGDQATEDYYRTMATLYIRAEDPPKAIATYDKLLEVHPQIADREGVTANLAALHVQAGNRARAVSLLRALILEYPTSERVATYRQSLAALGG